MKVLVAKAEVNISKRIAFIGLGAMGEPMAKRLMDAGFTVTSCANRSREATKRLAAKGLIECVTAYVSTGRDPRTSRSQGGAVINYAIHSLPPSAEPVANICASGVAERHPSLRFGR